MSQHQGISSDHISIRWILLNTLQASSMLPHFAYMSTNLFPTKIIDIQPLWIICSWTLLPSSSSTTLAQAFSTPTKVTESSCTPSCCIHQNISRAFCPCPHFTCPSIMVVQVATSQHGILLNSLQASSRLPNFAYMSTSVLLTKRSELQPVWMSCSWTSLQSSSTPKCPAHALITSRKVSSSGLISSHGIFWKICTAFSGCPSFTYIKALYSMQKCSVALFLVPPMAGFISPQARVLPIPSYVWNLGTNQKSRSSWSTMYSWHPSHKLS